MTILDKVHREPDEIRPGVDSWLHVDAGLGAQSLMVSSLSFPPDSRVVTHVHTIEEAMVVLEGELEAVLGDEVVTVRSGQTVLAPAGVRHGFVNRSGSRACLMAIFPTGSVESVLAV